MSRETRDEIYRSLGADVRAQQNAVELIDEAACVLLGVNRTDGRCLDIIDQHGRITAGDLAKASGLSTGAVTAVLDRLEWSGHIRRVRDDLDRRRVYVEVTPETLSRMHELYAPLTSRSQERLAHYTVDELTLIRDFVRMGRDITLEHAERLRAMVDEARGREGTIERVRRTAKEAKRDVKAAVGEVKRVAKDEKLKAKRSAKDVTTEVKRAVRGAERPR
jgi:DNA-binding MarR family transcriptional regulator